MRKKPQKSGKHTKRTENPASSASFMFSAMPAEEFSDEKNAAVGFSEISFFAGSLKRKNGVDIFWTLEAFL